MKKKPRKDDINCSRHISSASMHEIDRCGHGDHHSISEVAAKTRVRDATISGKKKKAF